MRGFYFGCIGEAGHYMFDERLRKTWKRDTSYSYPVPFEKVDGGLCKSGAQVQGEALLHHKDGWTALSFWDRTVDTRGGCNSNFFFDEILTFDEALKEAEQRFPSIFERFAHKGITVYDGTKAPPDAQRRWRVVISSTHTATLAHPMKDYRVVVGIPDIDSDDPIEGTRIYPCATCGWENTCKDGWENTYKDGCHT